jgi:short-subunit dehydrogenase
VALSRRLALVTGASAGIGAAFARLLAARGYDLAVTARRADRLAALGEEIRATHGVEVLTLPADLEHADAVDTILAGIDEAGRAVDALVNNAGYGVPGPYVASTWQTHQAFLQVMVTAPCELAHKVLPGMAGRSFGRIVNVASLAGLVPGSPGATLYGGAKALLVRFSQSLHMEVKAAGVHVSALCPGFTFSEFHDVTGTREQIHRTAPPFAWMSAEAVVEAGWRAVEANRAVCVPGAPNRLAAALARLTPDDLAMALISGRLGKARGA